MPKLIRTNTGTHVHISCIRDGRRWVRGVIIKVMTEMRRCRKVL